jgi:hypothetical protein
VREAGEELFDDAASPRVRFAPSRGHFEAERQALDLAGHVLFHRVALQRNLRDVRLGPGGALRNVVYHVAIYLGRTDIAPPAFRPQPSEIEDLVYLPAAEVDRLLLRGELAPNMAFLWLTQARALLRLAAD